ncbi:zinc finger protein CRM3 [Monosporozyma unispora]
MMPRISSTNSPRTFAYQGTPATVGMGYGSFIPSQAIPVSVPAYIKQGSFMSRTSSNNTSIMPPMNRDTSSGSLPSPSPSPSVTSSVTQLPPLSSLVDSANQSSNNMVQVSAAAAPLPKQVPQTVGVPSPVVSCLVQPPPPQHPTYVQLPQQSARPLFSGYPTPPSSIIPSPQSFIQPNPSLQQPQPNQQYVQVYMVPVAPRQSYPVNSYVSLVPSRSLSSPIKQNNSTTAVSSLSTGVCISLRSSSNPVPVAKPVSKPLPAILNKSNGKRMIQRQLSLGIRRTKQCPVCGKKCSRPSTLETHYFIHTGDTPYKCTWPNCTKAFNVKSNMIRHMKSHAKKLAKHNIH